jgi:hypothetical protein
VPEIFEDSWAYEEMKAEGFVEGLAEAFAETLTQEFAREFAKKFAKRFAESFAEELVRRFDKGKLKGVRSTFMLAVENLFPELIMQAEQVSQSIDDLERLRQIASAIFKAKALEEAQEVLNAAMK